MYIFVNFYADDSILYDTGVCLKTGKCKCMHFSKSPTNIQSTLYIHPPQDSEIETVGKYKYLGLAGYQSHLVLFSRPM